MIGYIETTLSISLFEDPDDADGLFVDNGTVGRGCTTLRLRI